LHEAGTILIGCLRDSAESLTIRISDVAADTLLEHHFGPPRHIPEVSGRSLSAEVSGREAWAFALCYDRGTGAAVVLQICSGAIDVICRKDASWIEK
jgi:hypothetical protein